MIHITTGPAGSDCTAPYYISFDKPKTVGEFIEEWLTTRPKEWGRFGIYKKGEIFGKPRCEYKYGEIIGEELPTEYLDAEIEKVTGRGGWTCSDFTFYLVERSYIGESKLIQLKPCPFCGGKAERGLFMGLYTVVCTNCPACVLPVPGEKYEDRVRDWNTRKEG